MAISIDTVYQRVLALANKEQRGYITPQEFNLFANQAQADVFEQYFYDLNQWSRQHGNDTMYGDPLEILEQKIEIFHKAVSLSGANIFTLPDNLYRLMQVRFSGAIVEKLTHQKFQAALNSPLTAPTLSRPIYYLKDKRIVVGPIQYFGSMNVNYIRKPEKVEWGYFVINDKALYDSDSLKTTDFELHPSEESELVYRILALAGVTLQKPQLTQTAAAFQAGAIQQEKQ